MEKSIISELTAFIEHAPTAFHAVAELKNLLNRDGFEELHESERWEIEPGKNITLQETIPASSRSGSEPTWMITASM